MDGQALMVACRDDRGRFQTGKPRTTEKERLAKKAHDARIRDEDA